MKSNKFPVVGHVMIEPLGAVPILSIRMMDDEREKELGARSAQAWKEAGEK